jgi:hypothetical protein
VAGRIDLATLKQRYTPKEPVYTSREQKALDAADRVVLRVMVLGEWKEKEIMAEGRTVRAVLEETQGQLRHTPSLKGVCLYVGAIVDGERMIASMPHEWIPASLKR